MIHVIELDIAGCNTNEELQTYLWAIERYYSIVSEVVSMRGPAGGNPLVKFSGHKEDLADFIVVEYCNYDVEDADFFVDQIRAAQ